MALSMNDVIILVNDKLVEQEKKLKKEFHDICSSIITKKLEDIEKKFNKQLDEQTKNIKELQAVNVTLNDRLKVIEKDMPIAFKEIEDTQRLASSTDQYVRRENIEISGIPHNCDDELEDVVLEMVNKLCKDPEEPDEDDENYIGVFDIQACHRIMSQNKDGVKNTIVRFVNRRVCEEIHEGKANVKNLKIDKLGNQVTKIYFNENLNKLNKELAAKCRRLKKKKLISETQVSNGIVKIKLNDGTKKFISHSNDLDRLFPNFVYFE